MFKADVRDQFAQRPTDKLIKSTLKTFDDKLMKLHHESSTKIDQLTRSNAQMERELQHLIQDFEDMEQKSDSKLSVSDGKRIWRHFQRFAEYNDLKELYSKCIPQLAKFE